MYFIYLVLQVIQKTADVHAIHLGVVKLKGDGQSGLEQTFPILSPCKKRIVPTAGILVDYHIQLSVWQCRGTNNHGILQRRSLTGLGGGEDADGGTVTINGGYVYAEGKDYGAGIGGGQEGKGGKVTITGGTVIAKAGRNEGGGLAIGSGEDGDGYGSLTLGDDLMVYTLSYIKDGSEMVFTQTEKKIEAGKPYLIVIHQGELELLGHSKLTTTADEGVRVYDWTNREQPLGWWRGTLTKIESADAAAMMAYALQSVGDFRRIRPDTPYAWWGAFRSMYCPDELPATNKFLINKGTFGGFGGQTGNVTFEGDAEIDGTGIESIHNSQFIIHNEEDAVYDLSGRKINSQSSKFKVQGSKFNGLKKGIYIVNGRKVVY